MRAPVRSHGFDKPSDLEDELSQLDEELSNEPKRPAHRAKADGSDVSAATLQREVDELRQQIDDIRRDIENLNAADTRRARQHSGGAGSDVAAWLPVVRSVAITSLAGRIFASSPIMALLVAAVPFALGLSAGSK